MTVPGPPDVTDARARSLAVVARLAGAAGADGFLPFDRFMEIALYAKDVGFYQRAQSPLGATGEYYTAAHVDPLFAETVAARVRAVRRALGDPSPFRIVELGPGDGTLAAGVVRALASEPDGWEYVLVDRALPRSQEAAARLAGLPIPVRLVDSVSSLGPFSGVVLANEFLDAQPTRRLRWDGTRWREMGIRITAERVEASDGPTAPPVPGAPLPADPPPGLVFELSPLAEATVREVGDHLANGAAIFLDYGMDETELVRAHPTGTLAAVRGHRSLADPLELPGTADLSTFVNFTRIRAAARLAGLTEVAFRRQAEALGAWGFPDRLEAALRSAPSAEKRVRRQLAAKNLLFGFDRFRVLELAPPGSAARLGPAT
jgi:SAM-dependent MidA family methyltransferase